MIRSVLASLMMFGTAPLAAQVGYAPSQSPYRDITANRWIEVYTGRIAGSGGPIPVGPRDGNLAGARIDFRAAHAIQLSLGAWYAGTQRSIVDADDSVSRRIRGPIPQHLLGGEATFQFNLSGGKSWHHLAPYAAFGIGLVHGQSTPPADTSGYTFGTKFYFAPGGGTRIMLGNSLSFRIEARAMFVNLKYPASYSEEPAQQPGIGEVSNAVNPTGRTGQYIALPTLHLALGFAF